MGVKKTCTKCDENKSISCFYKQKNGLYGRTGECKECRKQRTKKWTNQNLERKKKYNREYDKIREKTKERIEYKNKWKIENPNYFKIYYKQNSKIRIEANKRFWKNNPIRYNYYKIYRSARNSGKLKNPGQCQLCGEKQTKIHGHHFDYTKPLDVSWLCVECHKDIHRKKRFKTG